MKAPSAQANNQSGIINDLGKRFYLAAEKMREMAGQAGVMIVPIRCKSLPEFSRLTYEDKKSAVDRIELSCEILSDLVAEKGDLRNPNTVVWMACRKMGLIPPSDFFSHLANDDIIQIYSENSVHQFANLNFFAICSYTLEQMYANPWHLLWNRNQSELESLLSAVRKVLAPKQKTVIAWNGKQHRVTEVASPFLYETSYALRYISPLFDKNTHEKAGYIVVESVKLLNPVRVQDQERLLTDFYLRYDATARLRGVKQPDLT